MTFIFSLQRKRRVRAAAEQACRERRPAESVLGSVICADEGDRYVVRVFVGRRQVTGLRLPPWRECLIFSVPKDGGAPEAVVDDAPYRPTIR